MDGLSLHAGAFEVTFDQLRQIPTPEPTATWRPVPHAEIADIIMEKTTAGGFQMRDVRFGVTPNGAKMFGLMRLQAADKPDYTRAIGFRNSHDKSMCIGLTAGLSVFVCDNLCFSGDNTLHRKHVGAYDLGQLVASTVQRIGRQFDQLDLSVAVLKQTLVQDNDARALIMLAAERGVINASDVLKVLELYIKPPHPDFEPRTRWSLLNAFTEHAKQYSPMRAAQCYKELTPLFGMQ